MPRYIPALALIAALVLAGCRSAPVYSPQGIKFAEPAVSVTQPLTLEDYKRAIIRGGARRGWTFEETAPGHLVGKLNVRGKHFATVDVTFDTREFSISYKDSQNLKYDPATQQIHTNYNSWVSNLQNDIQSEITQLKAS